MAETVKNTITVRPPDWLVYKLGETVKNTITVRPPDWLVYKREQETTQAAFQVRPFAA